MKLPPFLRGQHSRKAHGSRYRSISRGLRNLLILAVAFSAFQWQSTGQVTWPKDLLDRAQQYVSRPEAGWHRAKDVLEEQGAVREGQPLPDFDLYGKVVRVSDGDTLSLLDKSGKQHKIRFYGIDSPELQQAYGKAAKAALSRRVYREEVGVAVVETDNYGRQVGTVYADGVNVNRALVEEGYAWWYRYHAPHERRLEIAEGEARAAKRGLWADDNPVPPWDWRRRNRSR